MWSAKDQSKYLSKLAGKRILVLGGTSGIGFCIAEAAVEHDAIVIVSSSNASKVDKAVHRLQTAYPSRFSNISGKTCNLADPAALEANLGALFEFATGSKRELLSHVAFTAGDAITISPIAEASVDYMRNSSVVRFIAPMVLAKIAPPYLCPGPGSSITFTGGVNAAKPIPGWGILAAYGAGVEGFTRGMAQDLKPIRVNLVSPGAVGTEYDSVSAEVREAMQEAFRKETLTGRIGRPEDLAEAYLYCMKDGFVTGTIISSDGGRILSDKALA
ncbi:hypothetical protein MMC29_003911, partial [Sticta canariensis]|nr:hypothetical protein [Sticta canariensis]